MLTLAQLPTGFTPLAVIVQVTGDIDIYIEPICGTTTLFRLAGAPDQEATLRRIRQLRDKLSQTSDGQALIQVVEAMTPALLQATRKGPDGPHLWRSIAKLLGNAFYDDDAVSVRLKELTRPASQLHRLMRLAEQHGSPELTNHLLARAVRFIREEVSGDASFGAVMSSLNDVLDEERKRLDEERKRQAEKKKRLGSK